MPHVEMTLQEINRFMVISVPAHDMQALSPSGSRLPLKIHERPDKPRCNDITPDDVAPLRLMLYHQSGIRFVMPKIRENGARLERSSLGGHLTFLKISKAKTRQMALPTNAVIKRLSADRDKSSMIASHKRASI